MTEHETNAPATYGKAMWSCRPDAGVKLATMLRIVACDGDNKARSPGRAWNKPSTIARGMPGVSGDLRCTYSCAFLFSHARLWARRAPGVPCALLSTEGANIAGSTRANSRREREAASSTKRLLFDKSDDENSPGNVLSLTGHRV